MFARIRRRRYTMPAWRLALLLRPYTARDNGGVALLVVLTVPALLVVAFVAQLAGAMVGAR